jgi:hypothetical protein
VSLQKSADNRDMRNAEWIPRRRARVRQVEGGWMVTLAGGSITLNTSWQQAVSYAHEMTTLYCWHWFGERP